MSDTIVATLISAAVFITFYLITRYLDRRRYLQLQEERDTEEEKAIDLRIHDLEVIHARCPIETVEASLLDINATLHNGLSHRTENMEKDFAALRLEFTDNWVILHGRVDDIMTILATGKSSNVTKVSKVAKGGRSGSRR